MLHETLWNTIRKYHEPRHADEIARALNTNPYFTKAIKLAGRCPTILKRKTLTLLDSWTLLATPLLSNMPERLRVTQHNMCAGKDCKVFDTSEHTYKTQHFHDCGLDSHCQLKRVDMDLLTSLVHRHVIPLIRSTVRKTGLHIEVIDSSNIKNFTAISHVWSGGLGNYHENEVYECQLMSIHSSIPPHTPLSSKRFYWLDTLCIPIKYEDKKVAMSEMARIYASARRVVVLDPITLSTEASNLSFREMEVVIASSAWMARSWTMQEAALAVDLDFRFRDVTIPYRNIQSHKGPLADSQLQALWRRDVDRSDRNFRQRLTSPEDRLLIAWRELALRNSKQNEDIAAIIAVFIDRSATEVLDLDPSKRVHALLRSQASIPAGLLFATCEDLFGKWTPKLPNCNDTRNELKSTTDLRFIGANLLQAADSPDLLFKACREIELLPNLNIMNMLIPVNQTTIRIQILFSEHCNRDDVENGKKVGSMLLLPRWAVLQEMDNRTTQDYPGLLFWVNRPEIHARFLQCFRWTILSCDNHTSNSTEPFSSDFLALHCDLTIGSTRDDRYVSHAGYLLDLGRFTQLRAPNATLT